MEKQTFVSKLRQMTQQARKEQLDREMKIRYDKIQSRWNNYVKHCDSVKVGKKRKVKT